MSGQTNRARCLEASPSAQHARRPPSPCRGDQRVSRHPRSALYGCGQILWGFAHVFRVQRHRQLKHSSVLTVTEPGKQYDPSIRKFQRVPMMVRAIIQMTHTGDAVGELLLRKNRECALVYDTAVEGQFG